ncbi:hypothetical protein [Methylobacterium brachythecii]|uniref:Uncharacterized protein n=1 Tax=Methylobacterium brachythecii TaxID=1176177 RepID=A0A7W6ALK3_9HYPH|nr:hypothetical protein [Methylobacterium brachythecii]MBB3902926.1 hypothetical protein [Methylobacterium brachythecii]
MGILRPLVLAGITGVSTLVIGFVAADRLAHTRFQAPPSLTIAQAPLPEPATTGTIVQNAEAPETKPVRAMSGFDTERLNALMRGEMPPAPAAPRRR